MRVSHRKCAQCAAIANIAELAESIEAIGMVCKEIDECKKRLTRNILMKKNLACPAKLGKQNEIVLSIGTSLTGWSSRRPQAALAGTLRASHSGAAYRERYAAKKVRENFR